MVVPRFGFGGVPLLVAVGVSLYAQSVITLPQGTAVRLRLDRDISSANVTVGAAAGFQVVQDILASGTVIIPAGTIVPASVAEVSRQLPNGKRSYLRLKLHDLSLANGLRIPLSATPPAASHITQTTTGGVISTKVVSTPNSPLAASAMGRDVTMAKGLEITTYTQKTLSLSPVKLTRKIGGNAGAAPISLAPALTNEDILSFKRSGLTDDQITAKIKSAPAAYRLDPEDFRILKNAGVSSDVIQAMIDAQHRT